MKSWLGGALSVAVATSSLVVIGAVTAAPAAAADPFLCTAGAVYVQSATEVREFDVNTAGGAPGDGGTLGAATLGTGHSTNGLGISSDGRYAYTVTNAAGAKVLAKHDRVTNTTAPTSFNLNAAILRGAVHPDTGVYYFASSTTGTGGINLYAWNESVVPNVAVQVGVLVPAAGSSAFGGNGDMAFSASGQLVLVADNYIYSADIPLTLTPSTASINAKQVHYMGDGVEGNGIAFGNLGHIFVSVSTGGPRIIEVDLPSGQTINTTSLGSFSPTDMSSCTFPNTLTVKKDLPLGRQAATDQFALTIDSPSDYQVLQTVATTTGNVNGVQPVYAGPVFTNQGDVFTLSEAAAGTSDLARYDTSLVCEQQLPGGATQPVPVNASGQVTQPLGDKGTEVVCTFVNERLTPGLTLAKTSDPATGSAVNPGQTVTYTVVAENTGNTVLDPVQVTDDLSDVLEFAQYQDDVATAIDGVAVTGNEAAINGTQLSWTGSLEPGQILTVTYSVVVDEGVEGETIANSVSASGTPPSPFTPITPPTVTTENPVPGFTLAKTADPANGTVVEPGEVIEYTVTATNTGATALNPVTVADNLSEVFAHAEYNNDITTSLNGEPAIPAATISGNDLAWTGGLAVGQTLTITYSVTVDEDASGAVVQNSATASATPTTPNPADPTGPPIPGDPIVPPAVITEHPVLGSGFTISKSADPASGTAVAAGDTIEYTITGTNTGDTDLDPAEILDDLSGVLDNAAYNDDVSSNRGSASITGNTLTWTGSIPKGQAVVITYTVTVDDGVDSALLRNVATGEATPQIPTDPSDPESPTTPGTPITPPESTTTHPVVDTAFEVTKTADPESGTPVSAGAVIEYTITGANTGNTVLDPAALTDDLSGLLGSVTYNDDVSASTGDVSITGSTLSWGGTLAPGDVVTITYSVTVNDDATGVLLRNTVEGEATPLIPTDPTDPESPTTPGVPVTPPPATTEHPVVNPGFTVAKTADPVTGSSVDPGSVIRYTVTGTNTGDVVLDPAEITDNLAGVLAHASYNDDAEASVGDVTVAGNTLDWSGTLDAGDIVTITYSVTVDADAGGETVANSVSGEAVPLIPSDPSDPESPTTPGTPLVPPVVITEHPVNAPGFEFSKTVNPTSGTAVDPGDVVTYTLTAVNTGETVLNPVDIVDDLSGVLAYATYNDDAVATIDGAEPAAPVVDGDELSWQGELAVGQTVTVIYSVTVGPDAGGQVLNNSATGTATPPGGEVITPPGVTTLTPVNEPGFSISKSAAPESGSSVDPGSVITYTVTGVNTGETALNPVDIVDDLTGVLAHAGYNGDATATVGGEPATAPVVGDDELTWTGSLQVGQSVIITYSVTVDSDAGGQELVNVVTGTATPPGGVPPIETPPATVTHDVNEPGFEVRKTADPASGTRVDPGSVITYTVTGVNTGETALNPVDIVDDLSSVLDHAVYNGDATASIAGAPATTPIVERTSLSWQGQLAVGERVTITYSVTVDGDAGGATIANSVSGTAVPPGGVEITPPPVTTEHPVATPGFTFGKSANPGAGTPVATDGVVTYTLLGVNTGETALTEVTVTDDLSRVLSHAKFNNDITTSINGTSVTPATLSGNTLSWSGNLLEGESVTITYSVTVRADAAGQSLNNVATASAVPPGGERITPPPSATENPILPPLAITGGQLLPWGIGLALMLLLGGGVLLAVRRRQARV